MTTSTIPAPLPVVGDEVRIIKTGQIVNIDEINTNANRVADNEVWAEGYSEPSGSWHVDNPEDVILLRRAADIPEKTLPTHAELVDAFSSSLHSGFGDDISIDETDTGGEPEGEFLAYGTSASGKRFACRVKITEIESTTF